jgi:hypothetical protein
MTAPMFKVFTGPMQAYTASVGGVERKFIKTTASSTVTDRKGHEFDAKALQKMGQTAQGMTIFLNHEYQVPEDLFGTVSDAIAKHNGFDSDQQAIWDLDLDVMVNEANPRAVQAWEAYQGGVRMGVSVGVIVKEWEKSKKNAEIMKILDVDFLEASIVGIPANPRTWVAGAVKSITAFSAAQADGTIETLELLEANATTKADDTETPPPADDEEAEDTEGAEAVDPDNDDSLAGQEVAKSATDDANTDAAEDVEESTDPEASASGATQDAPGDEAESQPEASVSAGIDLLVNTFKAQVQDLTTQLSNTTRERDEAREASRIALEIVERISSLPMGRKASYQHEIKSFRRDLSGVYGDDFLAFLERETS